MQVVSGHAVKCMVVQEAWNFAAATEAEWGGLCGGMGLVLTGGRYLCGSSTTNLIKGSAVL